MADTGSSLLGTDLTFWRAIAKQADKITSVDNSFVGTRFVRLLFKTVAKVTTGREETFIWAQLLACSSRSVKTLSQLLSPDSSLYSFSAALTSASKQGALSVDIRAGRPFFGQLLGQRNQIQGERCNVSSILASLPKGREGQQYIVAA